MKILIVFGLVFAFTDAQRPTYAGTSVKGYPELANRFRDSSETTENVPLNNRLGGDESSTPKLPTDARGDIDLVNRLNQWPRGNRPFWLLNSGHIEKHRHPDINVERTRDGQMGQNNDQNFMNRFGGNSGSEIRIIKPADQRSSFVGSSSRN